MPMAILASPRQSDCRKRAAARKRVSVLTKQWCCLSKSDGRSGMRLRVRGGVEPAPLPMRRAGRGDAARSKVVSWDGAMKAVPALSTRTSALALKRLERAGGDLAIRVMGLNFL